MDTLSPLRRAWIGTEELVGSNWKVVLLTWAITFAGLLVTPQVWGGEANVSTDLLIALSTLGIFVIVLLVYFVIKWRVLCHAQHNENLRELCPDKWLHRVAIHDEDFLDQVVHKTLHAVRVKAEPLSIQFEFKLFNGSV